MKKIISLYMLSLLAFSYTCFGGGNTLLNEPSQSNQAVPANTLIMFDIDEDGLANNQMSLPETSLSVANPENNYAPYVPGHLFSAGHSNKGKVLERWLSQHEFPRPHMILFERSNTPHVYYAPSVTPHESTPPAVDPETIADLADEAEAEPQQAIKEVRIQKINLSPCIVKRIQQAEVIKTQKALLPAFIMPIKLETFRKRDHVNLH